MISVKIYQNKHNHITRFAVKNHGEPIVCAAVSALVITCVNFLAEVLNQELDLVVKDEQLIDCTLLSPEISPLVASAVRQMLYGLELIAEDYPEEIKIELKSR